MAGKKGRQGRKYFRNKFQALNETYQTEANARRLLCCDVEALTMSGTSSGLVNHSDMATAAAFNVHVKLSASDEAAAAAATAGDETTRGQYDEGRPVSVAGTIIATVTATLSAAVDDGGSNSRIDQLEHGVDNLVKKMGIRGMAVSITVPAGAARVSFTHYDR